MKRNLRLAILLIPWATVALLPFPAFAKKQTLEELLAKARNAVSLSAAGPFKLEADVALDQPDGETGKGTYTLDWAAPGRFREEIHIPGYDEIKIASGTTLYRKRNLDYTPLRVFELEDLMNIPGALDQLQEDFSAVVRSAEAAAAAGKKNKFEPPQLEMTSEPSGFAKAECFSFPFAGPELCVDLKHAWPLKIQRSGDASWDTIEYARYRRLKLAYLPRQRRYLEGSKTVVEINVRHVAASPQFAPSTFIPPAGAEHVAWCDNLVPAKRKPFKPPFPAAWKDFPAPEILYGLVGADGSLHKVVILGTAGPSADADVRKLASVIRFAPATCAGQPVESETDFALSARDFVPFHPLVPKAGENGYSSPRCLHCPVAQFSEQAVRAKISGTVVLDAIIGLDGRAHKIRVVKALGYGLDEQTVKAVRGWRFKPATGPDGKPAAVHVEIGVNFQLHF